MARWKLMASHYLNTINETWEYMETDRKTGRPKRTSFTVPRFLDIKDPACYTNTWGTTDNLEGEIIVCHQGKGEPNDIVFFGDPTPDMSPLDDEAREISAGFEAQWGARPENLTGDYSQSLIENIQKEIADVQAKPVEVPGMSDLISVMRDMVATNQKLVESSVRRV